MKEFTAVLERKTSETQVITVVAKDEYEAGTLLAGLIRDLIKRDEDTVSREPSPGIKDYHKDNYELNDQDYEWDELECIVNCDEDEEEGETEDEESED